MLYSMSLLHLVKEIQLWIHSGPGWCCTLPFPERGPPMNCFGFITTYNGYIDTPNMWLLSHDPHKTQDLTFWSMTSRVGPWRVCNGWDEWSNYRNAAHLQPRHIKRSISAQGVCWVRNEKQNIYAKLTECISTPWLPYQPVLKMNMR